MRDVETMSELEIGTLELERCTPQFIHEKAQEVASWAANARDVLEMAIEEKDAGKRFALLSAADGLLELIGDGAHTIQCETPGPEVKSYAERYEELTDGGGTEDEETSTESETSERSEKESGAVGPAPRTRRMKEARRSHDGGGNESHCCPA